MADSCAEILKAPASCSLLCAALSNNQITRQGSTASRDGNYTIFCARRICVRVDLRCIRTTTGIWPITRQFGLGPQNLHIHPYTAY